MIISIFSGSVVIHAQGGSISGRLWNDLNTNGAPDSGEPGIPNITIVLYNVSSGACQSVTTNENGDYAFTGLSLGDYRIYETAGETTPSPAACPPTESIANPNTSTVTLGSIADPQNFGSSTPNRIDVTLAGVDLTNQNFGDFHSPPFVTCPSDAFLTQNQPSDLYGVDLVTGNSTLFTNQWSTYTNGIGFNLLNNYVIGYDHTNQGRITVIDSDFNITSLAVQGLGDVKANAGDISIDGYLYLNKRGKNVWVVDVNPQRTTYLTLVRTDVLKARTEVADWAFNAVDGKLYGVSKTKHLIQVDLNTKDVTDLGDTGITDPYAFGAVYFDKNGYFYVSNNSTGKIYRIDLRDPNNLDPTATFFTQGPSTRKNDGARCVFAPTALLDFGDAPNSYGVSLNDNGPRHIIDLLLSLGPQNIDDEDDGQPSANADGDDLDNVDDENGLNGGFPQLSSGATTYSVLIDARNGAGKPAYLYGYLDWNKDGDFDDAGERSAQVVVNSNGSYTVQWQLPSHPTPGPTFARFRIGSKDSEVSTPYGPAIDGEVEDYPVPQLYAPNTLTIVKSATPSDGTQFTFQQDVDATGDFLLSDGQSKQFSGVPWGSFNITETLPLGWSLDSISCNTQSYSISGETLTVTLDQGENVTCTYTNSRKASDYGDAPDTGGQTSGNNKAFHVIDANGPYLGATPPDSEATGIPAASADGDDNDHADDEDGLVGFTNVDSDWSNGGAIEVAVSNVGSAGACVYGWVDWDNDGFGAGSDSTSQMHVTSDGVFTMNFTNNIPAKGSFPAAVYLRLRVVSGACGALAPTGGANDGEVEDFRLEFRPTAITLHSSDTVSAVTPAAWLGLALLAGAGVLGGAFVLRQKGMN